MIRYVSIIVIMSSFSISCGWESKGTYKADHGTRRLQLLEKWPLNSLALRIQIYDNNRLVYTSKDFAPDVWINFVHVYWGPDHSTVAFFADGTRKIKFAYDFTKKSRIPFESLETRVAADIRATYNVSKSEDPFDCRRCTSIFIARHPSQVSR